MRQRARGREAARRVAVRRRARRPAPAQQVVEQAERRHADHEHERGADLGCQRVGVGKLVERRERSEREHGRQHDQRPGRGRQDEAAIVLPHDARPLEACEERRREQRREHQR